MTNDRAARRSRTRRAACALVLLGVGAVASACFLGRVGPALGHVGSASEARRLLDEVGLSAPIVSEGQQRRCGVQTGKFFDSHVCAGSLWRYGVVRGEEKPAWAEVDERLVLNGWITQYSSYPAFYSRAGSDTHLWLTLGETVIRHARDDAHAAELRLALDALEPGETLVGLSLSYQTPWDVLRTYTCYLPC